MDTMQIKEYYQKAKKSLSKPRFIYNFIVSPIVYGLGSIIMFVDLIMLLVAQRKLLISSLVLFGIVLVGVIVMACFRPYVFKADVKKETERLKAFFAENLLKKPTTEFVLPSNNQGTVSLNFYEQGIQIGNIMYSYDAFECALFTSNYNYRVNLIMLFNRTEQGDKEDGEQMGVSRFSLPADINLLSVMNMYNIKIANGDVFAFIKDNPEEAARQILKYGRIQNNYDKYKTR